MGNTIAYKIGFVAGASGKVSITANAYNKYPNSDEWYDWKEGYKQGHFARQGVN